MKEEKIYFDMIDKKENLFKNINNRYLIIRIFIFFILFLNFLIVFLINKMPKIFKKELLLLKSSFSNYSNNETIKLLIKDIINNTQKQNLNNTELNKFNENNILKPFIMEQNDFCDNPSKYYKKIYEEQIELKTVNLKQISFQLYMFKRKTFMSYEYKTRGAFEVKESMNMLKALKYYKIKKKISKNKEIFIIDIGGNIGYYPSIFGILGYSVLSFEPLERNYYVSKKNYCKLNRNSNVVIISKGLNPEEKTCNYYEDIDWFSNGMVVCDKKKFIYDKLNIRFKKISEVKLTKLSNFIPYLSDKNIVLIKLDIEGGEGKAIESGIEIITKFHVPFIFVEFSPVFLKEHGTDPKNFLKFFTENGYKISIKGFLNNVYISRKKLINIVKNRQKNIYFIHKDIIIN